MKKKIGLILHYPIQKSETFFLHDLHVFKRLNFDVLLFSNYTKKNGDGKCIMGMPMTWNVFFFDLVHVVKIILLFLLKGKINAMRYYFLLKKEGEVSTKRALQSIYRSMHILPYELDLFHFGFGTTTIHKELLPKAMNAYFTTSFRGYDITLFPVHRDNIYSDLWRYVDKVHFASSDLLKVAYNVGMPTYINNHVINDAINVNQFRIKDNEGGLQKRVSILSVGRLHPKKNYVFSIEVIKELVSRGVLLTYTIVGEGDEEEALKEKIKQIGLNEIIHLKGALDHKDVLKEMQACDIYIQCSNHEGFGVAILEAQATGLPVIITDAEGAYENVEHNKSGWVIAKEDKVLFANAIEYVINMPEVERKKICQYARERAKEKFNLDNYQKEWHAFFEEAGVL